MTFIDSHTRENLIVLEKNDVISSVFVKKEDLTLGSQKSQCVDNWGGGALNVYCEPASVIGLSLPGELGKNL